MLNGHKEQVDKPLGIDGPSADYVLTELAHLQATNRDISSHVLQRVNLHIAIVSGATAFIILWGQTLAFDQTAFCLISLLLAAILALGLLIYAEMVQWVTTNIYIDRASAKIKRLFHDQDPRLSKYMGLSYDDRPIHIGRRNLRAIINTDLGSKQIVTLLNNFIGGALGACVVLGFDPSAHWIGVTIGSVSFVLVWAFQFIYARIRYRLQEEASKKDIQFPRQSGEKATAGNEWVGEL